MRAELISATPGRHAATRVVMLAGAYHGPDDFLAAGFDAAVRQRHLPVDLLLVDPQLVYLNDRSFLQRLRDEAILPARAAGCTALWITGISLGGFLGLLYAEAFAADLAGLCLLAPYLGNRGIESEITRYASLDHWQAGTRDCADELDEERRIWRFIHQRPAHSPALHLGFGTEDRFGARLQLLAANLPP